MQRPIALPMIPASASGVSTQRAGPNLSRRPAVARKTPPARPTSSPITITSPSRASSTWKQSLIASTIDSSATAASEHAPKLLEIGRERRRRVDERVLEQQRDVRRRLGLGGGDPLAHQLSRPGPDLVSLRVVENAEPPQIALVAADALALLLLLDAFEVDVRPGIVGGR